jgi:hypothetical protein
MPSPHQPDLFDPLPPPSPASAPRAPCDPATFDDAALLEALPYATGVDCEAMAKEAVRRQLPRTVSVLDALCRRYRGFGRDHAIAEQRIALAALALIGGHNAAATLARILTDQIIEDPGLPDALQAALSLGCRLPPCTCLPLLRHANPAVRASAAGCALPHPTTIDVLLDLLADLNAHVAKAAAVSLGRMARREARAPLLHLLHATPSAEIIEAITPVADDVCVVALNRTARAEADLLPWVIVALEEIDTERAARVAVALRG